MQFDPNGRPIFDEDDASVYDYEVEEPEVKSHPARLLFFALLFSLITLAAASASVWIGVDLIGGHDISLREAVGGGWLITAIGGYAGVKAQG